MSLPDADERKQKLVKHTGSCHCGGVRFEVQAPADNLLVYICNCSICTKKQNAMFLVHKSKFKLVSGLDLLTSYTFNKKMAKHLFCKVCGVQSFCIPRSYPDGFGIMPHCIDSKTILSLRERRFDGRNWELAILKEQKVDDKDGLETDNFKCYF